MKLYTIHIGILNINKVIKKYSCLNHLNESNIIAKFQRKQT